MMMIIIIMTMIMIMMMQMTEKVFLQSSKGNFQIEPIKMVLPSQINMQIDFADSQHNISLFVI